MVRFFTSRAIFLLALFSTHSASAAVIYQSATLGPVGQMGGAALVHTQFLGARFYVPTTVQVTAIGGHLVQFPGGGSLFGAIVPLSGPMGLPTGSPFDGSVVASTTFVADFPSSDYRTPLSVVLEPAWYGLIFGSGELGASAGFGAAMPLNNLPLFGPPSFHWGGTSWSSDLFPGTMRFVVEGIPASIPEPATFTLLGPGLFGFAILRSRR